MTSASARGVDPAGTDQVMSTPSVILRLQYKMGILIGVHSAMALIRFLSIRNFRGIASLDWAPRPGINAIIGPGDSGKSTILEAIDLVLGGRRAGFNDADFYVLDILNPITIDVTVGELPKEILNLESYSRFLRGYESKNQEVVDEPAQGTEPVVTLRLKVSEDWDPTWSLFSERMESGDLPRDIRSEHRTMISAQRLGMAVGQHLAWGKNSVLTRLSDGKAGLAAALANATRVARSAFDVQGATDLESALGPARKVARAMAVARAVDAQAALDARAVNVSNGALALHDSDGVPLRALGLGSSRLMAAGLQAAAAAKVPILLLDEAEQGLEPHRISRMLHELGSKAEKPTQQVFLTTHSPVVLRELSAGQIRVARMNSGGHLTLLDIGDSEVAQPLLRSHPDAFLSPSVLVCEGLTEIGLCRGIDIYETSQGRESFALCGVALADGRGTNQWKIAADLASLGFRVGLFRDSDREPPELEATFIANGGAVFAWDECHSTEDQLFASLDLCRIRQLLEIADKHHTVQLVNQHLGAAGFTKPDWQRVRDNPTNDDRKGLARAARMGWFKRIDFGEEVGRDVVAGFSWVFTDTLEETLDNLKAWIRSGPANVDP